ncbi:YveK family protein [Oceanobacillus massiliensis]|uniref:YveK family protein n=1 Tax=Oceanobacillus massiliensis TaxID=1465765 RepID=UPI000289E9EE|nr:Wzz/FepE/Etk N-terminal domain-containing protein [Oceanobacillus massiliensis]
MEETISLKEIFGVLKKRFLMILTFVFGAALVAAIISYFVLTPTYQSSSQFIVNQELQDPTQYNTNNIQTNVQMINTYNIIIKSPAILDEVVSELDLPYSSSVLGEKIEVSSADSSQVVTVIATDEDPAMAVEIANATVGIFQNEIPEIMSVDNVSVLNEAQLSPNPKPVAPNPLLNIAIAIVLGAMVGIGIAFLIEYLDNSITTEDDVEKKLGLPVLGVISFVSEDDIRSNQFMLEPNRKKRSGFDGAQEKSF